MEYAAVSTPTHTGSKRNRQFPPEDPFKVYRGNEPQKRLISLIIDSLKNKLKNKMQDGNNRYTDTTLLIGYKGGIQLGNVSEHISEIEREINFTLSKHGTNGFTGIKVIDCLADSAKLFSIESYFKASQQTYQSASKSPQKAAAVQNKSLT